MIVSDKISVFPNPVSIKVTVKIADLKGVADIRVFDIYGKMVLQQASGRVNTQLDLSMLPAGVYMKK